MRAMGTALSPISSLIFGSYAAMVIVVYYGLCVRVDGGRSQAFVQRGPLRYYLSTPLYFHRGAVARLCSLCIAPAPGLLTRGKTFAPVLTLLTPD